MYESHFGFSGPPFQLVPDPGFFFGSRGHSNALAFLQSAAQQGDGFLVVTGEIGAGKTTLVRTLLEGLDSKRVMAATMVSTQLESGELPQAILLAFGVAHSGTTRAQFGASLEAYLLDLANQGRRALLIVDEAQNLGQGLIEELRLLSNLQAGAHALLQVFLVGQPDLRKLIQAKAMEQLRQRVTASCHLGPLDAKETQAYVQHRLHRVGWTDDKPGIEAPAYATLHHWTAGIPRRINRLCNRLLLAAFLEGRDLITAESVEQIARDLRSEIGEPDEQMPMQDSYVPEERPAAPPAVAGSPAARPAAHPVVADAPAPKSEPPAAVPDAAAAKAVAVPKPVDAPPAIAPAEPKVVVTEEDEESDSRFAADAASDWAKLPATPPAPARAASPPAPAPAEGAAPARRREQVAPVAPPASKRAAKPARPATAPPPVSPPDRPAAQVAAKAVVETRPAIAATPAIRPPLLEPLVLLVDSADEYVKARALGRSLSEAGQLPPVLIVHTGSVAQLHIGDELAGVMPQTSADVHLDINEHGGAASAALAITRFDALLRAHRPKAVLAMGASDTLLMCTLFAHKSGVRVLRNDAGRRRAWSRPGEEMNAVLLEHIADSAYISDLATYYTLYRAGIPTERVLLVGNLADNVLHCAAQHVVHPREILTRAGVAVETLNGPQGYALCTAQVESARHHDEGVELISMLTRIARDVPVLWAASPLTVRELESSGKLAGLERARIGVVGSLAYLDCVDLLRGARCLLAGTAGRFLDDAVTLGVPSIVLGKGIVVPVKSTEALQLSAALPAADLLTVLAEILSHQREPREAPTFWDGGAAGRIAAHLAEWLPKQATAGKRGASPADPPQSVERLMRGEPVGEGVADG